MDSHHLCEQFLHWHRPRPSHEVFAELARYAQSKGLEPDTYGSGRCINEFEQEIADLLGKESGLFVVSGVMAQQIALRIWCEHQRNRTVAFHATSHLERNEQRAYSVLQGLDGRLIGDPVAPLLVKHVQAFPERLSALLVELPLRHLGGVLPRAAKEQIAREHKVWLAARFHDTDSLVWARAEIYMTRDALDIPNDRALALFNKLMRLASA